MCNTFLNIFNFKNFLAKPDCICAMKPSPISWKLCATPKICKKLCCSTKIVDFTAIFQKFLAVRAIYTYFDNVVKQHMHFCDNIAKQHTHFFVSPPPLFEMLATALVSSLKIFGVCLHYIKVDRGVNKLVYLIYLIILTSGL